MTMTDRFFAGITDDLPDDLPVFPLSGVLLLPRGHLPLNVFEPRYIAMVDDALQSNRLIGIIQPRQNQNQNQNQNPNQNQQQNPDNSLFQTGCAGKITCFNETDDGRYEITLKGICRFHVATEKPLAKGGYRNITADWSPFQHDRDSVEKLDIDRIRLKTLLKSYFTLQGMDCDWSAVDGASDDTLITALSMICPLDCGEKQALLEASCSHSRAGLFMTLLEMAIRDGGAADPYNAQCH